MLDRRYVEENTDEVIAHLVRRDVDGEAFSDGTLVEHVRNIPFLARARRVAVSERDRLRGEANAQAKAIGQAYREGNTVEAERLKQQATRDKATEADLGVKIACLDAEIEQILLRIPNPVAHDVPDGMAAQQIAEWWPTAADVGERPSHVEIAEKLGLADFDRGSNLGGSGFSVLTGAGATLDRVLRNLLIEWNTLGGYTEMVVPHLVRTEVMQGTGQLPKFGADMYRDHEAWLIPTGEVPLTNLHAGEILEPEALPKRYTSVTQCFRREAGGHGKLVRGLIRQHEFAKVELVRIERAEDAGKALSDMVEHVTGLLRNLNLPHRVILLGAQDTGFSASKTFDIEVWLPSIGGWMEISSVSWCGEFQARRMNLRYRPEPGAKPVYAHTLNGSCLPIGRLLVALLEHGFNPETGTLTLPEGLHERFREALSPGLIFRKSSHSLP